MKFKKFVSLVAVISILGSVGLIGCGNSEQAKAENEEEKTSTENQEVAIRVNDETLSQSEFDNRVNRRLKPMMQRFGADSMNSLPPKLKMMKSRLKRQTMNKAVGQMLLLSYAKDSNINVSKKDVNSKLEELVQNQPQVSSKKQLTSQLKKRGMTMKGFRKRIKDNLMIQQYLDQEVGEINVTDADIDEFLKNNEGQTKKMEKISARHILIKSDSQAQQDIEEIKRKLDQGDNFKKMARKHSEGPSSRKGGDLGEFSRGKMVPAFEEVAFNLGVGEVSDPVQTKHGYHIIKVDERVDTRTAVQEKLENQQRQKRIQKLVRRLRNEADIEKNVEIQRPQRGMKRRPGGAPGQGQGQQRQPQRPSQQQQN